MLVPPMIRHAAAEAGGVAADVQLISVVMVPVVVQAAAVPGRVAADRAVGQSRRASGYTAPPPLRAELPLTVQLVSVVVPADVWYRPPPPLAELPLTVQSVSVVVLLKSYRPAAV